MPLVPFTRTEMKFKMSFQISRNVPSTLTTAMMTPTAPTLKDHSTALVAMVILEMESRVLVS